MNVIKTALIIVWFVPNMLFGQQQPYPKDTIYVRFDKNKHFKKELNHPKLGKNLYFKGIGVFYNYKDQVDTLSIKHLKDGYANKNYSLS